MRQDGSLWTLSNGLSNSLGNVYTQQTGHMYSQGFKYKPHTHTHTHAHRLQL